MAMESLSLLRGLLALCFAWLVVRQILTYLRLRHVPGPFLARWSNISRTFWVLGNSAHDEHISLHQKYGPIVRFGPNMVSVQDPAEIKHIYDMSGTFIKSNFYRALLLYAKGKPVPTIFATQNENLHRSLRRPIASLYSMSNVVTFEHLVDKAISVFLHQLRERFVRRQVSCDLGEWLQYLAFDVMGEMTFSKRFGFLDRGTDVSSIAANNKRYFDRVSPITQITWVDWVWSKNPVIQWLRPATTNPVVIFAHERARERVEAEKSPVDEEKEQASSLNKNDFLSRFREIIRKDAAIPPFALTAWTVSNVAAGSDTTAILLRKVFHELLQHPASLARLVAEVHVAVSNALAETSSLHYVVPWSVARKMPYLDAVIKEAGRMHPPFGLPFERVVPAEGATICGQRLPAGTIVGMSAWVMHRHAVFGKDCESWRPERWLECSPEQRKAMDQALLTFGAGNRVCLGKNVAYFEAYKIVPTILRAFELYSAGHSDWKVANRWFVHQSGLQVHIQERSL